jgi:ATP-dependent DNA helicase RecQ
LLVVPTKIDLSGLELKVWLSSVQSKDKFKTLRKKALRKKGIKASHYHAGMKAAQREEVQAAFMVDEVEVIVATTAFGMGVDKPNVRFVFNADISDSLDCYYQEMGRAGRDGEKARALLFYRSHDLNLRRFLTRSRKVNIENVLQVVEAVQNANAPVEVQELQEETELSQTKLTKVLSRLEEVEAVEILPTGEVIEGEGEVDRKSACAFAQLQLHKAKNSSVKCPMFSPLSQSMLELVA